MERSYMYELKFSLIEKKGEKTDALIEEMIELSKVYDIYEECSLSHLVSLDHDLSVDENKLIYVISLPSAITKKTGQVLGFLNHVFQKMFNKYPAFTEAEV